MIRQTEDPYLASADKEGGVTALLLTFLGACHEVTGSCYLLEACGTKMLVDYGLEQGADLYASGELPVAANDIDYVFLTHAHIDHSGRLPELVAQGFHGTIHCTEATRNLCDIMLRDSAHIQEFETEWKNRKARRAGRDEIEPMYTVEDAVEAMRHFRGHKYNETISISDGVQIRFIDAGHLLGSASIEIWITENGVTRKLVFSGDIGNLDQPLIRDPQYLTEADYIIMESTYGDRTHGKKTDFTIALADLIEQTMTKGGNLVIPSFAVGRTQEILYFIREIKEQDLIPSCGDFKVYVDSPLAVEATNIYVNSANREYFDGKALELVEQGINPIEFSNLKLAVGSEESRAINYDRDPKVIISASGMCDAGRIKHHLKYNLWREECTVLFVGYQAVGTLGRRLVEGAHSVRIFGEDIEVLARVMSLPGTSGHADVNGLMTWIGAFEQKPRQVFVCHGEDTVTDSFADRLRNVYDLNAYAPYPYAKFDLRTGSMLSEGNRRRIEKKPAANHANLSPNSPYGRLVAASKRLQTVVEHNFGGANKDLGKFADQIIALCEKWDR